MTLRFLVLSNWVNGMPLTDHKIIEAAALERNRKLCFKDVKFEMPVDIQVAVLREAFGYMSLEHGERSELESSVYIADFTVTGRV